MKRIMYSYETKMKVIEMKLEGYINKQINLINALDDYTQAWLEQVGEKNLATEVNEKIGISKGVQESMDYLKKLERSKDRGPSLGGR